MFLIRLLIIGDTGVGKTSLLVRFNENFYVPNQKTTIGVDYKAKEIQIDSDNVKLQIWDTAGQERFRSMTSAFYSRAQGVVITFDVTQSDTFRSIPSWIKDVNQHAPTGCVIILCANKAETPKEMWKIKSEEFHAFAKDNGFTLFEVSAVSGENVNAMFEELGRQILKRNRSALAEVQEFPDRGESLLLFNIPEGDRRRQKKKCCT